MPHKDSKHKERKRRSNSKGREPRRRRSRSAHSVGSRGSRKGSKGKVAFKRTHSNPKSRTATALKAMDRALNLKKEDGFVTKKQMAAARKPLRAFRSRHDQFMLGIMANVMHPLVIYPLPGVRLAGFNSGALFSRGLGPGGDRIVTNGNTGSATLVTPGYNECWWNEDGSQPSHMYTDLQNGATANKPVLTTRYCTTRGLVQHNFKLHIPEGKTSATYWIVFDPEDTGATFMAARVKIDGNFTDPFSEADTDFQWSQWDNDPFGVYNQQYAGTNTTPPFKAKTILAKRRTPPEEVEVISLPKKGQPQPPAVAAPPQAEANLQTEILNYIYTGGARASLQWINKNDWQSVAFRARSSVGSNPDSFRRPLQIYNDLSDLNWPELTWLISPTPGDSVSTDYRGCAWTCMHKWDESGTFSGKTNRAMKKLAYAMNQDLPFYEVTINNNVNMSTTVGVTAYDFNYVANAWFGLSTTIERNQATLPFVTPCFGPPDWIGETMLTSTVHHSGRAVHPGSSPITQAVNNLEPNTPTMTHILSSPNPVKEIAKAAMPQAAADPANHVTVGEEKKSAVESLADVAGSSVLGVIEEMLPFMAGIIGA